MDMDFSTAWKPGWPTALKNLEGVKRSLSTWTRDRKVSWMPVAHTCNLSYSGAEIGRMEVQSQPQHIVLWDPISKKAIAKKKMGGGGDWRNGSKCRPWVQAPVPQKKSETERLTVSIFGRNNAVVWMNGSYKIKGKKKGKKGRKGGREGGKRRK
jgi:hypothetical protein